MDATFMQDEENLRRFERKILRKIFGPICHHDGSWRIRTNYEINVLINNANIVRFIKPRGIRWLGHAHRMEPNRSTNKIIEWRPFETGSRGRPMKR